MSTALRSHAFQLKGGPITLTTLLLQSNDLTEITAQLSTTIAQSPTFFSNAPVVIDFNSLQQPIELDVDKLLQVLRQHGLIPVGIRSQDEQMRAAAILLGIAVFPSEQPVNKAVSKIENKPAPAPNFQATKVITQPIRSGQQIYAKDSDLLVLSTVSPGAEILADGNIYVYGALRGRALAGINGNKEAHILCQALEAELISVAGYYQISENIKAPQAGGTIHIYLNDDHLCIATL